jgi:hypothetical protein
MKISILCYPTSVKEYGSNYATSIRNDVLEVVGLNDLERGKEAGWTWRGRGGAGCFRSTLVFRGRKGSDAWVVVNLA